MSSANPANFTRTIKLRSVVDAEYKTSYNRISWMIDADDFSSDLSQSYLALRMYLCHADGVKLTAGEFTALDAQNIFISFGQNDQTYSPACLVKTARLFACANYGTPLEEVNFCNTLTQSLYQLMNDFESVASSSLTANNAVVFGHPESQGAMFANLLSDTIGAGQQVPIEVHIMLSDLFGVFKSRNFYLNDPAIMGLRVDLELEDLKPLFRSQVINEQVVCPAPLIGVNTTSAPGFVPTLAENPITSLTGQNNTGQMTMAGANGLPIIPDNTSDGLIAKTSNVLQKYQWTSPFFPGATGRINSVTLTELWGVPELESFGFVVGASVRLNFRLQASGGLSNLRQDEIVSRLDTILSVTTVGAGVTRITFLDYYAPVTGQQWTTDLDSLEVMDSFPLSTIASASWDALWSSGKITVADSRVAALQSVGLIGSVAGLVAGQSVSVSPAKFTLHCQTNGFDASGSEPLDVIPWFDTWVAPDVATSRQLISNRCLAMPIQGATTQLLSAVVAGDGTSLILTFKKLGMVNDNSLAPAVLYSTTVPATLPTPYVNGNALPGGGAHLAAIVYNFWISDFNGIIGTRGVEEAWTYLIDKSELVLVQSAKQPGVPMNRVYSTSRAEVTTIQSAVPIYNYQFVVPEENVYNIMLMTPQYNTGYNTDGSLAHSQSLISWQRGVTEYRWSINQVDQCNRNLEVGTNTSFYPSSLYLESLIDVLGNGNKGVMSLAGPLTIPHSDTPVVTFPLRIYKSFDGQQYIFHPQGFVAQITLYADTAHDGYIVPGNVYFWKQMLRTF